MEFKNNRKCINRQFLLLILTDVLLAVLLLFLCITDYSSVIIPIAASVISAYVYGISVKRRLENYYDKVRLLMFSFILFLYAAKFNLISDGLASTVTLIIFPLILLFHFILRKTAKMSVSGIIVCIIFLTVSVYTLILSFGIAYSHKECTVETSITELLAPGRDFLFMEGRTVLVEYYDKNSPENNPEETALAVSRKYYDNAKIGDKIMCDIYTAPFGVKYIKKADNN